MIILFIIGLLFGAVAVIFALQNTAVITVTFLSWHLTGSLALVLLLTITSGILIAIFLLLPEFISSYLKNKNLKKENLRLEQEILKQTEQTVLAKRSPAVEENIVKI